MSSSPIQTIPPSPDATAAQHAQTQAQIDEANNAAFLAEIVQTNLVNDLTVANTNQTSIQTDASTLDSLLNIDTPTLSLFNEIGTDPRSANVTGNLTAQQMQAIGILIKDDIALAEAANSTTPLPLTGSATTVDLSVEAQNIIGGVRIISAINVPSLTPTQLAQIGEILAPVANQPLNPALLLQIQTQISAAGLDPLQLSLSTIFLVMNYLASMQPPAVHVAETGKIERTESKNEETVAPTTSTDKVAAEDSAILPE